MSQPMEVVSVNVEAAIAKRLHLEAERIRESADVLDQQHKAILAEAARYTDPNARDRIKRRADRVRLQRDALLTHVTKSQTLARATVLAAETLPNDTNLATLDPVTRTPFTEAEIEQHEHEAHTIAWQKLRDDRDELLRASDWTQAADSPLDEKTRAAWAKYRAKLRDLPAKTTDPAKVRWPTPPS